MANSERSGLLGTVEMLLGAAAVIGAAIYVLLNGVYVVYYEQFGLKPEDVGLDRLAILGRVTGLAILVIYVGGAIVASILMITGMRRYRAERKSGAEVDQKFLAAQAARWRFMGAMVTASVTVVVSIGVLVGFRAMADKVEGSAQQAREGKTVGAISLLSAPVIDIQATPARVTWVGDGGQPDDLGPSDSRMLYLGRSEHMVALLTCDGVTLMPRPSDVVVRVEADVDSGTDICP